MQEEIQFIRENLSPAALYGQLAEEAAELAQAALKMQRYLMKENPPRKNLTVIKRDIAEEYADIQIVMEVLGAPALDNDMYLAVLRFKPARWAGIVKKVKEGEWNG